MHRSFIAVLAALTASGAAPVFAQTPWTFEGVPFKQRPDWCAGRGYDSDGAGGQTEVLKVKPCGSNAEVPALSAGAVVRGRKTMDLADLAKNAADQTDGDAGKKTVDAIFASKDSACKRQSFEVERNPVSGVPGFAVSASYACPNVSATDPTLFNNFVTYAQRGSNGDVWVVAFDYNPTMSEDDKAMVRAAVAAIAGN